MTPLTAEEIKSKWDAQGEYARNQGTWMHYNIERIINKLPANTASPEMQHFLSYQQDHIIAQNIIPYRTGTLLCIWHTSYMSTVYTFCYGILCDTHFIYTVNSTSYISYAIYISYTHPTPHTHPIYSTIKSGLSLHRIKDWPEAWIS